MAFLEQLDAFKTERLTPIVGDGRTSFDGAADATKLLQVALSNEINVSELASLWMPTTAEVDVKIAFARQAGDEANHFNLVADRLAALGFDIASFTPPPANPMFQFLRGLTSTIERITAGLYVLETIAYGVNENFIALCEARGDAETVRIYRKYIQPDERAHQDLGRRLLAKYVSTPADERLARDTAGKLLDIAGTARAQAASKLGTTCFPGC
jgi:hypothetical protein